MVPETPIGVGLVIAACNIRWLRATLYCLGGDAACDALPASRLDAAFIVTALNLQLFGMRLKQVLENAEHAWLPSFLDLVGRGFRDAVGQDDCQRLYIWFPHNRKS